MMGKLEHILISTVIVDDVDDDDDDFAGDLMGINWCALISWTELQHSLLRQSPKPSAQAALLLLLLLLMMLLV